MDYRKNHYVADWRDTPPSRHPAKFPSPAHELNYLRERDEQAKELRVMTEQYHPAYIVQERPMTAMEIMERYAAKTTNPNPPWHKTTPTNTKLLLIKRNTP